jgi:heptosyltransferase-3
VLPETLVRRVLIYRLGSLGDMVVALPCFHLIARAFPNAERRLLTNYPVHAKAPAAAVVLGEPGLIHGYTTYTNGTRNPYALLMLAARIRRFRPDVVVYLAHPRAARAVHRDLMFFRAAGVRRMIGISDENQMEPRFDWRTGLYEAEAVRLTRMIGELGDPGLNLRANWSLVLTDEERQQAMRALGKLVEQPLLICGPGTKMPAKDWGADNWRDLLGRVGTRHPDFALALVGAREESEAADYAASLWPGPKANLCGSSPRVMAAMIEHAQVFLGPDSGPMHVAAAAGVSCVVPFAATQLPGRWFPFGQNHHVVYHRTACAGCRLETCSVEQQRCMTSISVDEMDAAAERALSGSTGMPSITMIA